MLGARDEEVIMRPTSAPTTLATTVIASAVLLTAAACGSAAPQYTAPAGAPAAGTSTQAPPASSTDHVVSALKTASTPLGDVVTDSRGVTLYLFTKDTKGTTKSACTGQCITAWPPAVMGSSAPKLVGVTGTVGSIAAPSGGKQVTLDGWPLYYYAQDTASGDMLGQGIGNVWWVLAPSGSPIKGTGSSSSPSSSSGGSMGGY